MAFYNCIVISSAMVRSEYLQGKAFNEYIGYQGHEYVDLWLTLCSVHKAVTISQHLTIYRIHHSQISAVEKNEYKKQALKILKDHFVHFNALEKCIAGFRLFIHKVSGY